MLGFDVDWRKGRRFRRQSNLEKVLTMAHIADRCQTVSCSWLIHAHTPDRMSRTLFLLRHFVFLL